VPTGTSTPTRSTARLRRLIRQALQLSAAEILTALHTLVVMVVVELLIRWVRLPKLSRMLGVRLDLEPVQMSGEPLREADLTCSELRQVHIVRRVTGVWPFGQGPCLRRSLVIGHLLRRRNPAIRLGVATAGEDLFAHAWVEIDGRPLERLAGITAFQIQPARMPA
jgi:Transglutaminase-like superfamily